jgi:hypothetical protein
MAGPDGAAWGDAAKAAGAELGIDVKSYTIGAGGQFVDQPDESAASFSTAYGIGTSGASLVRPDGYVAWRAAEHTTDAADRLTAALRQVLALAN